MKKHASMLTLTSLNMSLNMQTSYTVKGSKIMFPKFWLVNPLQYQH